MKRMLIVLLLLLCVFVPLRKAHAVGNGEVVQGRQSFFYNVQMQDQIKALVFDGEWGLTPTLAANGRYAFASPVHYFHFLIKFKLYESKNMNVAGRAGLLTDFSKNTPIHKTIGVVLTQNQNSFLKTHGGFDYSMDTKEMGFFVGIDYKLTAHTYFQAGYEKFVTNRANQGLTFGLRTDL